MRVRCGEYIFDLSSDVFDIQSASSLTCPFCGSNNTIVYVSHDYPNMYDETYVIVCNNCGRIIAVIIDIDVGKLTNIMFCESVTMTAQGIVTKSKLEVFVLNGKIVINSPDVKITQQLIEKLKQFGVEVEVQVPDVRCG